MLSVLAVLVVAMACPWGTDAQPGYEQYDFSFLTDWYATACCRPLITLAPGERVDAIVKDLPRSPEEANAQTSCKELCAAQGACSYCRIGMKIYPNAPRRADLGLEPTNYQVYDRCNSKYTNVCCCVRRD